MSTKTTNLQLNKPDTNDYYDINIHNENMDIIDSALKQATESIEEVSEKSDKVSERVGEVNGKVEEVTAKVNEVSEKVDEVSGKIGDTSNQAPTYSEAGTLTALISGETMPIAFGKIAKAVSSLISHLADTTSHITNAERTAWNAKLDSSGTASKATADASGNNIANTYATKTELANTIGTANVLRVDFEDILRYFTNTGSQLIMRGFLTDHILSISIAGYVDASTATSGRIEQKVDASVFGDFFKQVNMDIAIPMINGTVRNCTLSVSIGSGVITEFIFTKNGVTYTTSNYDDYGNDSTYALTDMVTYSGVSIYLQNMLDATYIKYPLEINASTTLLI